ncbi:hypothetical protein [Haloechinothrix salitolerans]|uniref:XRE family transcriptional regulator n=1 Tax=Haloechinothrix salitolerans TaxID=926830 RepID=A0ABW2C438_9PSEU
MLDQYKRWERGRHKPTDPRHRGLLAAIYGTVSDSLFGETRSKIVLPGEPVDDWLIAQAGMDTMEILQRIRRPSINDSTVDALSLKIEQLCCEYPYADPRDLIIRGREWLNKLTQLLRENNLTLDQHRDILHGAGQLALLVGCVEYDINDQTFAEATRSAAMQLGVESGSAHIVGWAHEMTAWFALTRGDYRKAIDAAQAGQASSPNQSVAVQLAAQEAKAWARMGDHRNVTHALERGRQLLERMPYPERPDNHFVVDPDKFDFYAMDCYRIVGENSLAAMHANEVVRKGTRPDGTEISPMRNAEARITLGVVAAREGDLEQAVSHGLNALSSSRQSRPSLTMVGSELDGTLRTRFGSEPETTEYHDAFVSLRRPA